MLKRCGECGGNIELIAKERKERYKGKDYVLPADFELPTCIKCGEEWINMEYAEKIDAALKCLEKEEKSMDWAREISDAKVQYDKDGAVAEVLVLPMDWMDEFLELAETFGSLGSEFGTITKTDDGTYMLWGAEIMFANSIDKPVAAGYRYKYLDSVRKFQEERANMSPEDHARELKEMLGES